MLKSVALPSLVQLRCEDGHGSSGYGWKSGLAESVLRHGHGQMRAAEEIYQNRSLEILIRNI